MTDDLIEIGRVRRAVGLDGRVEVELNSGDIKRITPGTTVLVGSRPLEVRRSSPGRKGLFNAWFEEIGDRDSAEALRGDLLEVPRSEIPPAPEGSHYHYEIIGCAVQESDGSLIGEVTGIMETGANDVYVVALSSGGEILVPVTPTIVLEVDIVDRVIKVDLPPGLRPD